MTKQALIDSIAQMTPEGNVLRLPEAQIDNYPAVKKALLAAGGVYKRNTFVFKSEASEIQAALCAGEVIDDKKKYQFFPTPPGLAAQMIEELQYNPAEHALLEPSVGHGALIEDLPLQTYLLMDVNPACVQHMTRKGYAAIELDFLQYDPECQAKFERIIANPPFTKNQDIDHVMHMYKCLAPGGRMVSLTSCSWVIGGQKKQVAFRHWLKEVGAEEIAVPMGTFKSSGTNVESRVLVIDK